MSFLTTTRFSVFRSEKSVNEPPLNTSIRTYIVLSIILLQLIQYILDKPMLLLINYPLPCNGISCSTLFREGEY